MQAFGETVNFIWEVADLLRGDFKAPDYETFVLPFTVLRRFDCVLEATRPAVRAAAARWAAERGDADPEARHRALLAAAEAPFYNDSPHDLAALAAGGAAGLAGRLRAYVAGFDPGARRVLEHFRLDRRIGQLDQKRLLLPVVRRFAAFGLYPPGRTPPGRRPVDNHEMGYIFEELIRKFKEQSQETAGEHFTPREVVRLMVDLLFCEDADRLAGGAVSLYDPACGTGGMLSAAEEYVAERGLGALRVFGQEVNDASYAICLADAMLKGYDAPEHIEHGNSLTADGFADATFDYCISNPPYGVSWKKVRGPIEAEAERGFAGRFGAGLPRISDGSLLFLQHMIAKMKPPAEGGTRIAVVFAGSPLFTGPPGSGESEIRRWIIENDWLEAIVALPPGLFYNTGIRTYVWLVSNRKAPRRRGRIQLIDATDFCDRMPRSMGDKRNVMRPDDIARVVQLYRGFAPGAAVRIFDRGDFGFRRVVVERPLRLRFRVDAEAVARVEALPGWQRLGAQAGDDPEAGRALERGVLEALRALGPEAVFDDRAVFVRALKKQLKARGLRVPSRLRRAICLAVGERDPDAKPCLARDGLPEPDPLLRDTEDVPLDEPIGAFLAREVLPYAPDAWAEPEKAKVGYQIQFERVFHTWEDPRPVAEVEAELRAIEAEAAALLAAVLPPVEGR